MLLEITSFPTVFATPIGLLGFEDPLEWLPVWEFVYFPLED